MFFLLLYPPYLIAWCIVFYENSSVTLTCHVWVIRDAEASLSHWGYGFLLKHQSVGPLKDWLPLFTHICLQLWGALTLSLFVNIITFNYMNTLPWPVQGSTPLPTTMVDFQSPCLSWPNIWALFSALSTRGFRSKYSMNSSYLLLCLYHYGHTRDG